MLTAGYYTKVNSVKTCKWCEYFFRALYAVYFLNNFHALKAKKEANSFLDVIDWLMWTRAVIMPVCISFLFFSNTPSQPLRHQLTRCLWVFVVAVMNIYVFLSKTASGTASQEGWFTWSCVHSWCAGTHKQARQLQSKEGCNGFIAQLFISVIFRFCLRGALLKTPATVSKTPAARGKMFRNKLKRI